MPESNRRYNPAHARPPRHRQRHDPDRPRRPRGQAAQIAISDGSSARDRFPELHARITFRSERELTVEIVAGEGIGFADTVEYESVAVRDGLAILSWQEHIGSTIVHVLDFISGQAYTAVTPARAGFGD